jgi:protein tyrosine phosphatase (PTP) superfamily phosphohydrolase (DUF442 family)
LSKFDLTTASGRLRTTVDHLWNDHAYLRLGFSNAHWISHELVRTNQPWPFQLKAWSDNGIRTVINLRGGFDASFRALEVEACQRLGLELVDFVIASRDVPTRLQVLGARDLFERVRYPALMHCRPALTGRGHGGVLQALPPGSDHCQAIAQLSPLPACAGWSHWGAGLCVRTPCRRASRPALTFAEWVEARPMTRRRLADFKAGWWAHCSPTS